MPKRRKKIWAQPKLTVVVRENNPEELVLYSCKAYSMIAGVASGPGHENSSCILLGYYSCRPFACGDISRS